MRDLQNLLRFGTVLGPGAVVGTLLVRWDEAHGANVVKVERIRLVNGLKLCL